MIHQYLQRHDYKTDKPTEEGHYIVDFKALWASTSKNCQDSLEYKNGRFIMKAGSAMEERDIVAWYDKVDLDMDYLAKWESDNDHLIIKQFEEYDYFSNVQIREYSMRDGRVVKIKLPASVS